MIIGIIGIVIGYRKFSFWVGSQKFYYERPHASRFLRKAVLPVFAIVFITVMNAHIQSGILLGDDFTIVENEKMLPQEIFAKILNTFNILVIGYTISHLIPISLNKREKIGFRKRGF